MKTAGSTLRDLENVVSMAADLLSASPLDHHTTRRHIEALLFLKLITDIGRDLSANNKIAASQPAWSTFIFSPEYDWKNLQPDRPDLPHRLNLALQVAECKNYETLEGIFSGLDFQEMSSGGPRILEHLVHLISTADLRPSLFGEAANLGHVFENLTAKMLPSPELGEFNVPSELADLIAGLVDPKINESIIDPVCGSGRLLSALVRHNGSGIGPIAGQDWRTRSLSLCKSNLFAHGASARIKTGNSLYSPLRDELGDLLRADVVVGNPPFGLPLERHDNLAPGIPKLLQGINTRVRGEYSFVIHMLEIAREGSGRVAAIVPLGALFRREEIEIRRRLIEENLLSCVIALPAKLFTGTKIAVAILFLQKDKRNKKLLFIDASQSFVTSGRLNLLSAYDTDKIVRSFRDFKEVENFSYVAEPQEIRDNDFQLNVNRYISQNEPKRYRSNILQLRESIAETESELAEVRGEIETLIDALGIRS